MIEFHFENNKINSKFKRNIIDSKSFVVTGLTSFLRLLLVKEIKEVSNKKIIFVTSNEQNSLKYQNDLKKAFDFMVLVKKSKFDVHGCFVIGLPGETEQTARETIDFSLKLGLTTAQFSGAVPFPGTDFYRICCDKGWLKAQKWSDWLSDGEQSGVVEYPTMRREQINYLVDLALKKFYFRLGYMVRFVLINRSFSDFCRKVRGACNFFGYLIKK